MPDALPAVTRAVLRRTPAATPRRESSVVPALMNSSAVERDRVALALRDHHRNDLVLELAGLLRRLGLVLAGDSELVLLRARNVVLLRDVLGGRFPCGTGCRRPTGRRRSCVSISLASPMRKPSREPSSTCGAALMFSWPPAMTMSASPHLHRLRGQHHRLQSRAADLVDRHRGNLRRQSGLDRRLARRILAAACGQHLPRITSEICSGLQFVAGEQRGDHRGAELGRRRLGQRAAEIYQSRCAMRPR